MPKVISGFKCPYTKRIYHVGEEYNGERLKELQEKGYIEHTENVLKQMETKITKPKKNKE